MKFTLNWLREYVDVGLEAGVIADRLTMLGLEVDSVTPLFGGPAGLKTATILEVSPHPGAGRLTVCRAAVGEERYRVVCGAPNARPGLRTVIALPGITLPSGATVREAIIRGEKSSGMFCSEKELGLSEDHGGIMELPEEIADGQSLVEVLELEDTLIEVDLTPNRPDCACVVGIAREVAGFAGVGLRMPAAGPVQDAAGVEAPFSVVVDSVEDCPRYAARLLRNVTIGPSPWWLRRKLLAVGVRPINNVVDVTNLVMMELGQPLHAFDFSRLAGGEIVVRRTRPGEKIVTLDGVERTPDAEMLMICDRDKPVAVAGVMGGENSEVNEQSTDILLESACFDPLSIRRTARRLNLGTEASYRFERGVDPEGAVRALDRCVSLLVELAGAETVGGCIDCYEGKKSLPLIPLRVQRTNELLGLSLNVDEIARYLSSIEIEVTRLEDDILQVRPPSFRVDLEREVDLVEEVARLVGYNEIPSVLPRTPMSFPVQDPDRLLRERVAAVLSGEGFSETIHYSFTSDRYFDRLGLAREDGRRQAVALLNPLSEEQNIMRTMLLPGLLEATRRNINHQNLDLRLMEIGKVFQLKGGAGQPREHLHLGAVLSGRRHPFSPMLHFGEEAVDLYDARGVAEAVLEDLRLGRAVRFEPVDDAVLFPCLASGTCLRLVAGMTAVGNLGKIEAGVLKTFGIKQDVYYLEMDLDLLLEVEPEPRSFAPLPRYPSVKRDVAVLVPEDTPAGEMVRAVHDMDDPLVEAAELFDVYVGEPIERGYKSVAVSVTYRSADRTLDDETVNREHQRVMDLLVSRFRGRLRETGQ